ncbi:MAG TPA: HEPN domain-containing protein [Chitinophagaceae bacterium]|nr:HEPN domain-containing protein [Chitinophagaceae bacterium]
MTETDSSLYSFLEKIIPVAGIERIYLLGEQIISKKNAGIFIRRPYSDQSHKRYLLLFLVNAQTGEYPESIIESLTGKNSFVMPWIMKLPDFKNDLQNKNHFVLKVYSAAELLFNARNESFIVSGEMQEPGIETFTADAWLNRAEEFLAGAELYLLRKQIKMSAFCLHQSAEQAYTAIIFRATGYRPRTHNLLRLHQSAVFFSPGPDCLFPEGLTGDESLLCRLQKAYTEARYMDNFHFPADKLSTLLEKIRRLIGMAATVF